MSETALNVTIWICNLLLLGCAVMLTVFALSFERTWIQAAFAVLALMTAGYTLVQRLRYARRLRALQAAESRR